jgi:hypothetical protein
VHGYPRRFNRPGGLFHDPNPEAKLRNEESPLSRVLRTARYEVGSRRINSVSSREESGHRFVVDPEGDTANTRTI